MMLSGLLRTPPLSIYCSHGSRCLFTKEFAGPTNPQRSHCPLQKAWTAPSWYLVCSVPQISPRHKERSHEPTQSGCLVCSRPHWFLYVTKKYLIRFKESVLPAQNPHLNRSAAVWPLYEFSSLILELVPKLQLMQTLDSEMTPAKSLTTLEPPDPCCWAMSLEHQYMDTQLCVHVSVCMCVRKREKKASFKEDHYHFSILVGLKRNSSPIFRDFIGSHSLWAILLRVVQRWHLFCTSYATN